MGAILEVWAEIDELSRRHLLVAGRGTRAYCGRSPVGPRATLFPDAGGKACKHCMRRYGLTSDVQTDAGAEAPDSDTAAPDTPPTDGPEVA